jgi:hypothetical protein
MASTEPLSGVTVYDQNDQALGGQQMGTLATQLGPLLNLRYTTTGARDQAFAAWVAKGNTIPTGASVYVGSREYVYNGGWQAQAAFRGAGTSLPSDAIAGDTYYHNTYRCTMRYRNSVWRQQDVATAASDTDRSSFVSALNVAGLALHEGFQVFQTDTGVLFAATGTGTALNRVATPGFLQQATGQDKTAGSTSVTAVSMTVTVPDGLPSFRRIKVKGTAFVTSPTGVGAVVFVGGTSRTISTSLDGDVSVTYYDTDLSPGTRTYNMSLHSTVSGQNISFYAPVLSVGIV